MEIKYGSNITTDSICYASECCNREYEGIINEDSELELDE